MEVAKLLIEHGAPCGSTDRAGWSSFHYAANHRWATWSGGIDGQLAVLELLAAHGADINAGDGEGYTCVHSAAQSGKVAVVKLLRRLGARPDGSTVRGVLPIHVAAEGGRGEVVDELLRWCPELLEAEDCRGHRPIHHAAYHGHADVVEVLLRHGASVCPGPHSSFAPGGVANAAEDAAQQQQGGDGGGGQQSQGTTPLHLAVRSNKLAVVMILLAGGANPLRQDSHGWTPRALAAECAQRRPGADHAAAFKAIDAALEQAETGVPLVWSRAAHHKYPAGFKRRVRRLLCAMAAPMRRHDVRGLVAEVIADDVIAAAAKDAWPQVPEETWGSIARTRAAAEARWFASGGCVGAVGGGAGAVGGEEDGYVRGTRRRMELGWFGGAGYALRSDPSRLHQPAAGWHGIAARSAPYKDNASDDDEDGEEEEVQSAPPPPHHHQQQHHDATMMNHEQQLHQQMQQQHQQMQHQQMQQQQQEQHQFALNVALYQQQLQRYAHSAAAA